jgi:hypothetical protein
VRVIRQAGLGIPTSNYTAMISFLRDTMGCELNSTNRPPPSFPCPNDDRLLVFGPGHPYFAFFEKHSSGLVSGEWVIGDFGLIQVPDAETITQGSTGPG